MFYSFPLYIFQDFFIYTYTEEIFCNSNYFPIVSIIIVVEVGVKDFCSFRKCCLIVSSELCQFFFRLASVWHKYFK